MRESAKRVVRTAQTFLPWAVDIKASVQHRLGELSRKPFEVEYKALRLFGGEGRLYLDVGANRGQSIMAIRMTTAAPRIISFEANPALVARLAARFGDLPGVRIEPVGLGDRGGEFDLHIPVYRGYAFDGLASVDRDEAVSWLNHKTILGFDPSKLRCEVVRCRLATLDSFATAPFLIKLHIQGYELPALIGGRETLGRHGPVLLIGTPGQDVTDYLAGFGYRLYGYEPQGRFVEGLAGGRSSFYMTDEKAASVSRFIAP
jgi:FkbM family methyltransferase